MKTKTTIALASLGLIFINLHLNADQHAFGMPKRFDNLLEGTRTQQQKSGALVQQEKKEISNGTKLQIFDQAGRAITDMTNLPDGTKISIRSADGGTLTGTISREVGDSLASLTTLQSENGDYYPYNVVNRGKKLMGVLLNTGATLLQMGAKRELIESKNGKALNKWYASNVSAQLQGVANAVLTRIGIDFSKLTLEAGSSGEGAPGGDQGLTNGSTPAPSGN